MFLATLSDLLLMFRAALSDLPLMFLVLRIWPWVIAISISAAIYSSIIKTSTTIQITPYGVQIIAPITHCAHSLLTMQSIPVSIAS